MQFSSNTDMLMIGSIHISLSGLCSPWKYSCMKPFQTEWFSSLLNRKDHCQRISIPELLDPKGCMSCIPGLRVILDSLCSSSDLKHLNRKFFSSVMFVAFSKDLNYGMWTDSDGSCYCVFVDPVWMCCSHSDSFCISLSLKDFAMICNQQHLLGHFAWFSILFADKNVFSILFY